MKNTFPLEQIAKTREVTAYLILSQYKFDKMAKFMEIKSTNPKLKQSEKAREQKISSSKLQRYRGEKNAFILYNTTVIKHSHKKIKEFKTYWAWPRMTSKWPQTYQVKIKELN